MCDTWGRGGSCARRSASSHPDKQTNNWQCVWVVVFVMHTLYVHNTHRRRLAMRVGCGYFMLYSARDAIIINRVVAAEKSQYQYNIKTKPLDFVFDRLFGAQDAGRGARAGGELGGGAGARAGAAAAHGDAGRGHTRSTRPTALRGAARCARDRASAVCTRRALTGGAPSRRPRAPHANLWVVASRARRNTSHMHPFGRPAHRAPRPDPHGRLGCHRASSGERGDLLPSSGARGGLLP